MVQSQLKNWTRRLEATARKQKFGAALHLAEMETLTMTPGLATQASQLWGAVIGTIQHSEALMQEAEGYEMAHPEFNENGAWLMAMLTRRLPERHEDSDAAADAREKLRMPCNTKLPSPTSAKGQKVILHSR